MKAKDFLINNPSISVKHIAAKMWPNNRASHIYMSKKLNGERPWTEKDETEAKRFLNELADEIKEISK